MGCFRFFLIFFAILFLILSILIASGLTIGKFQEMAFRREAYALQDHIPVREVFEQSKEYLDLLLSSEELGKRRTTINADLYITLSLNEAPWRVRIAYEDWDSIEWITEEEKYAIRFLITSEILVHQFTFLDIWGRQDFETELVARLYPPHPPTTVTLLEIAYNNTAPQQMLIYSEYLDDGYHFRIWTDVRGVDLSSFFIAIAIVLMMLSILFFFLSRKIKHKALS